MNLYDSGVLTHIGGSKDPSKQGLPIDGNYFLLDFGGVTYLNW